MTSAEGSEDVPKKRNPKIRDAEILAWVCANLKEECGLSMSIIESLAWEKFKRRGVKRHGFGGAIRRLLPAHSSAFPHRLRGPDLFVYEGGLWSLKPGAAAQLQGAEPAQEAA